MQTTVETLSPKELNFRFIYDLCDFFPPQIFSFHSLLIDCLVKPGGEFISITPDLDHTKSTFHRSHPKKAQTSRSVVTRFLFSPNSIPAHQGSFASIVPLCNAGQSALLRHPGHWTPMLCRRRIGTKVAPLGPQTPSFNNLLKALETTKADHKILGA